MKLLLLLGALVLVVFFVVGVVSPRLSHRVQGRFSRASKKGEEKADRSGGSVGDRTRDSMRKMRHAGDISAESGRRVNRKLRGRSSD